ncbi:MAG: hypothetical protein WCR55_10670 [Lentisphaerota bacterium]
MNQITANRVPHIIFSYWLIKIASTTLGETGADMFSMTFNLGYAITILFFLTLFIILLWIKLSLKKYTPTSYWFVFTASAIVGTAISDFIDRTLGLGYTYGSAILLILLLLTLFLWYLTEKSLSVEKILTAKAECFYWVAFLIANTLGTALGDFLADELGIGFLQSAVIIAMVLILIAMAYYWTKMSGILLFWLAFVLTRPFGATFGDLLTKPADHGGLNFGTIASSGFFVIVMILALLRECKVEKKV